MHYKLIFLSEIAKKLNALIKLNIKNQVDAVGYELKEVLEDLDGVGKQLEGGYKLLGIVLNTADVGL